MAFKGNALALVEEEHRSITDVARELGVTTPTFNTWRKQYGRPLGVRVVAPTTEEKDLQEENALLRAEIVRLHTREEIVKNARDPVRTAAERYSRFESLKGECSLRDMCDLYELSRSGFYAWKHRHPCRRATDDGVLIAKIDSIYAASGRFYGSLRV